MFRSSNRDFAALYTGIAPIRRLQKWILSSLWSSILRHQPVSVQPSRFLASISDKSVKHHAFKLIMTNSVVIGPRKFTFNINEFIDNKNMIMVITQSDTMTHKHRCQIWLSIPAAETLLTQFEAVKAIVNGDINWSMNISYQFIDTERQKLIELNLENNNMGKQLVVAVENRVEDKRHAIFVPLDGFSLFHEKLTRSLQSYESMQDPNQFISKDLCETKSFADGPKQYFLNLREGDKGVFVKIREYNVETDKKRHIHVPIASVSVLYDLLIEAYKFIQSHEGHIPNEKKPRDVLFEKSFNEYDKEYTVSVKVSEPEMRHFGDMILNIKCKDLNKDLMNFLIVRSIGVPLFLHNYVKILHEYDCLNPTSTMPRIPLIQERLRSKWNQLQVKPGSRQVVELKNLMGYEGYCPERM